MQAPKQMLAEKGVKQVGLLTSAKRGQLMTLICALSAIETSIPPLFFSHVNFKERFVGDELIGSIGAANKSS